MADLFPINSNLVFPVFRVEVIFIGTKRIKTPDPDLPKSLEIDEITLIRENFYE